MLRSAGMVVMASTLDRSAAWKLPVSILPGSRQETPLDDNAPWLGGSPGQRRTASETSANPYTNPISCKQICYLANADPVATVPEGRAPKCRPAPDLDLLDGPCCKT